MLYATELREHLRNQQLIDVPVSMNVPIPPIYIKPHFKTAMHAN
jgi:hypothetical protein